jgi:hypothetical protein
MLRCAQHDMRGFHVKLVSYHMRSLVCLKVSATAIYDIQDGRVERVLQAVCSESRILR